MKIKPSLHVQTPVPRSFTTPALFVAVSLLLAGCLQIPPSEDPASPDNEPVLGNQAEGSWSSQAREGATSDGSGGSGGEPGDRDERPDGGNETASDRQEDLLCHEQDPPTAAQPREQRVDGKDDVRCPGQFTVTQQGSGPAWDVPAWETADWWRYETQIPGYSACHQKEERVVATDGSRSGVLVYQMELEKFDCDGEPQGNGLATLYRTKEGIMELLQDGFIEHQAVFPLKEGKQWVYMARNGHLVEIGSVTHDTSHLFGTKTVEVWHVEWTVKTDRGTVEFEQTWSVDVKNLLEERMTVSSSMGPIVVETTLIDSNHEIESGGLPVNLPDL